MLIRDAVSSIRGSFKWLSSDNLISDRVISQELKNTSFLLIKREIDKRKLFSSPNIFTELPCVEMEQVPLSTCCDYKSPCTISRSKNKLPKLGESMYGVLVQGTFSIDRKVKFNQTDPNRFINYMKLYPKKENDKFFWVGADNYLYISDPEIEKVRFIAFFEEDVDFSLYSCEEIDECPTNPLDLEFKCPGYLETQVLSMVRDTLLKTYKRSLPDAEEDDRDTSQ